MTKTKNKFDVYAEGYFTNLWQPTDSEACEIFTNPKNESLEKRAKRVKPIFAPSKYRIDDNFEPKTPESKRDFKPVLEIVDAVQKSELDSDGAVQTVERVIKEFHGRYGRTLLVAASKTLWFKFKSPIVIIDKRVKKSLGLEGNGCYEDLFRKWHEDFKEQKQEISCACARLSQKHPGNEDVILAPWFEERVFDICLWEEGK